MLVDKSGNEDESDTLGNALLAINSEEVTNGTGEGVALGVVRLDCTSQESADDTDLDSEIEGMAMTADVVLKLGMRMGIDSERVMDSPSEGIAEEAMDDSDLRGIAQN
jgi:hypothetical protein